MYKLTRDDGVDLQLNGSIWEYALELAFLYGWKPAGTEMPRTLAWLGPEKPSGMAWNSRDYFSRDQQHVGRGDARALAEAVLRALRHIPALADGEVRSAGEGVSTSPIPSRASALADGLSAFQRRGVNRFAKFAVRGGFTIGEAP